MGKSLKMKSALAILALRALVASASELQELSNTDVQPEGQEANMDSKDVAVADEESSDVGEGQFGGAFWASGSFTMMAASGGFEEEESDELGEGQFGGASGGALLTSGSFTMMAASGGFE